MTDDEVELRRNFVNERSVWYSNSN